MSVNLTGRDLLTLKDFRREEMDHIFNTAKVMETLLERKEHLDILKGQLMASLFFQPSTRTRLSFESAMQRLGGGVIGFASPEGSRSGDMYKETLADASRVLDGYADIVAIRHPQVGAPSEYARFSDIPVINAGDGFGEDSEHPTQALTDFYTILKLRGAIDGVKMLVIGDMRFRSIHSYGFGLAKYDGVKLFLLPPDLAAVRQTAKDVPLDSWLPKKNEIEFSNMGLDFTRIESIDEVIAEVDVINVNGVVHDRSQVTPEALRITREKLNQAKEDVIVMSPLPRLDELDTSVDEMPNAKYFYEAHMGIPVRMAVLALLLGKSI